MRIWQCNFPAAFQIRKGSPQLKQKEVLGQSQDYEHAILPYFLSPLPLLKLYPSSFMMFLVQKCWPKLGNGSSGEANAVFEAVLDGKGSEGK